jgi:hypothetical protein
MAFPRRLEDLPPWATKTLVFFALWALVVANAVKMVVQPFYRMFFAPRVANILRTPDERFSTAAPWLQLPGEIFYGSIQDIFCSLLLNFCFDRSFSSLYSMI